MHRKLAKTEKLDVPAHRACNTITATSVFIEMKIQMKQPPFKSETVFLILQYDKQYESGSEKTRRHPAPRPTAVLQTFLILFPLCHTKISLFNIQVDLQIAFLYESLSLWLWPLNTFIRAKNSIANETQRSSALPHRETGCLPIVHAAWERRGSSAQPGPAHLSRLKADPV